MPICHSMRGWSIKDMGRAYAFCNELIFAEHSGIRSGALFLLQKRVRSVISIDKKYNQSFWRKGRPNRKVMVLLLAKGSFDINSCTSIPIDRMIEDFEEDKDWAHYMANCWLLCSFANSGITWKNCPLPKCEWSLIAVESCQLYSFEN